MTNCLAPSGGNESNSRSNNTVTLNSGTVGNVFGARSQTSDVSNNDVSIAGGTAMGVYGGMVTGSPSVTGNHVTLDSGTVDAVIGGYISGGGSAIGNDVTVNNGNVSVIMGGWVSGGGSATGNFVTVNGGAVSGDIYGGRTSGNGSATGNTVTISGSPTLDMNYGVYGGVSLYGDAFTDNKLYLNSAVNIATVRNFEYIYFGSVGTANITTLNTAPTGVTAAVKPLVKMDTQGNNITFGGVIEGSGGIEKNGAGMLALTNTNTYTGNTTVQEGYLEVKGTLGSNNGNNYAGDIYIHNGSSVAALTFNQNNVNQELSGVISGNGILRQEGTGTLTLSGDNSFTGLIEVDAGGTLAVTGTLGNGNYTGNINNDGTLIFNQNANQTLSVGIISGTGSLVKDGTKTLTLSGANTYSDGTTVNAGTLELAATGTLQSSVVVNSGAVFDLYGSVGNSKDVTINSNGTLNAYQGGTITGNLNAANANLNFYVPVGAPTGATMLTVTGTANIADSKVNVGIDGESSVLQVNDQITLIEAGTLNGAPTNGTANGQGMQGVSLEYEFALDWTTDTSKLLATVTKVGPNEQTKSFSEAWLSQLAFTNQGTDLIADQGLSAALDATATRRTNMKETITFGTISGGSSRYKTGSHSDVTGLSLITGLAGNSRLALGKLTLGAFFEYGDANYDSYNSFVNADSVRGNGKTDYTGGGVLAHLEFNPTARGNAWLESSARFGRATVDFKTNDMFSNGIYAAFDSNSNYSGAHIGAGYHWKLTKQNGFDLYAQYLWSQQNADTAELTTGETVKFEVANSERLRLGSRFVYNLNPNRRAFAGIAWEHEFDSEANASISGFQLDTPKLTGDTCKLELGLTLQPTKTCPVTRNFGIQGYTGKREGVAGSIEVRYEF